jgi:hypothetical protein
MKRVKKNIQTGNVAESYAVRYPHLVGIRGWLLVIVAGLVLSIMINFYLSVVGLTSTTQYTVAVTALYPSLVPLIMIRNVTQCIIAITGFVLLIMIFRRQKQAIQFAITYFALILVFGVVTTIVSYIDFNGNSAVLKAAFKNDNPLRLIAYSSIWLAYFISSRRVRATLDGNEEGVARGMSSMGISTVMTDETAHHDKKYEKQLATLEKIAFDLDQGCRDGQVSKDETKKASRYLKTIADDIIDSKSVGAEGYIVYEIQALLAWINHEEDTSRQLAQVAADVKGDDVLFTQTANMILRS